jgi:LEA14-like dessication related protein
VTKQFWVFLLIGLAVVGALIYGVLMGTKGSHVDLTGEILKVRVLALSPQASLVVVDFRVTNPADIPFVVNTVQTQLDRFESETVDGVSISKADVENVFKYEKLLGPK